MKSKHLLGDKEESAISLCKTDLKQQTEVNVNDLMHIYMTWTTDILKKLLSNKTNFDTENTLGWASHAFKYVTSLDLTIDCLEMSDKNTTCRIKRS